MKVILARTAGFCHGVRTAIRLAISSVTKHNSLQSDGPLIHNEQVMSLLRSRGINVVQDFPHPDTPVLIRAHGLPPNTKSDLSSSGFELIDATCVHVSHSQRIVSSAFNSGKSVVIVGSKDHAEVIALSGCAPGRSFVINSLLDAKSLLIEGEFIILAQTTFSRALFLSIVDILQSRYPDSKVYHTICHATEERQEETRLLCNNCEALVVVGGKHSSNTQQLANIGFSQNKPVFFVETSEELLRSDFSNFKTVGVTAGASTPYWLISSVVDRLSLYGSFEIRTFFSYLFYILVNSRLCLFLSAFFLSITSSIFLFGDVNLSLSFISSSLLFFSHIINHRTTFISSISSFSLFDSFLKRYRFYLIFLSLILSVFSLYLSVFFCFYLLFFCFCLIFGSLIYCYLTHYSLRYRNYFLSFPCLRDLIVSFTWSLVIVFPLCLSYSIFNFTSLFVFLYVFIFVLGKNILRYLQNIDSDYLLGLDTIPVFLGPAKSIKLLYIMYLSLLINLLLLSFLTHSLQGIFLFFVVVYLYILYNFFQRRIIISSIFYRFYLEFSGILSGLLSLFWVAK